MKNFIIELQMLNGRWDRSWSYPHQYTMDEAQACLDEAAEYEGGDLLHVFRITSLTRKPYRRHAAVTPLELRGAIAMLDSAAKYIVEEAYPILMKAKLAVIRQMRAL